MGSRDGVGVARAAGSMVAPRMSDPGVNPRLVVRDPVADAVAKSLDDGLGVVDERLGGFARRPAAYVLERLRGIPVEQRRERFELVGEQLVDQAIVEVEACLVDRPAP